MIVKLSATKFINSEHIVKVQFSPDETTCALTMSHGPVHYLTEASETEALRTHLEAEAKRTEQLGRIYSGPAPVTLHLAGDGTNGHKD